MKSCAHRTGRRFKVRIVHTTVEDTIERDKVWCGGLGRYAWRADVLRGRRDVMLRFV